MHSLGTWDRFPPGIEGSQEYRLVNKESPAEKVQSSMLIFRRGGLAKLHYKKRALQEVSYRPMCLNVRFFFAAPKLFEEHRKEYKNKMGWACGAYG